MEKMSEIVMPLCDPSALVSSWRRLMREMPQWFKDSQRSFYA